MAELYQATPLRILLIEDEKAQQLLVQYLLEHSELDCHVTIAGTVLDGLALLSQEHFDLVLLDLSLPDSLPIETLHSARSLMAVTPVIILTGYEKPVFENLSRQLGAFDYFVKTATRSDKDIAYRLIEAIKTAVNKYANVSNKEFLRRGSNTLREINHRIEGFIESIDGTN